MTIDLPDVNVLAALHLSGHPHRDIARAWFDAAEGFATTPMTQAGLLRLLLNPTLVARPDSTAARRALSALLAAPGAVFWADDSRDVGAPALMDALTGYRQVTDLHLLAIAASHGARLVTLDTGIGAALRAKDRKHLLTLPTIAAGQ
jgi:toxin-antitoxin system PIN domain toxin